ncbi:MAG: hypothetical protein WC675_02365 [Patescibacteria group bacterium]|jgi:hypothetical protein
MRKIFGTRKVFIFVILAFFGFVMVGCSNKSEPISNQNMQNQPKPEEQKDLVADYESNLVEILKPYWESNKILGIKDKILALKAPAQYLDLHFSLVVAFESLEQGQLASDQNKIEDGQAKIQALKTEYPWLE